ncbi:hypothetical protein C4F51_15145 [Cellvibrio sp. KB43]|uniref:Uncharacterized protein n=1 Tax=Cellvibrio polysaccharolyticus TaxID=2082724 RepID=A0A928V9J1_9GAMM|nr:hypothetical protein [Cellvibrio polysaccharolyticus]
MGSGWFGFGWAEQEKAQVIIDCLPFSGSPLLNAASFRGDYHRVSHDSLFVLDIAKHNVDTKITVNNILIIMLTFA